MNELKAEFCRLRHRQVCGLGFSAGHVVTTHTTRKKCYIRIRIYLDFTEGYLICLCFGRGAFLLLFRSDDCFQRFILLWSSLCLRFLLQSNFLKLLYGFRFSFLIFCLCFPVTNYLRTADGCKQAGTAIMEGVPAPSPSVALKNEGNTHFKAGNFLKAAALYTQAIKKDPENAALYRSSLLPSCASQILILFSFLCWSPHPHDSGPWSIGVVKWSECNREQSFSLLWKFIFWWSALVGKGDGVKTVTLSADHI